MFASLTGDMLTPCRFVFEVNSNVKSTGESNLPVEYYLVVSMLDG